MLMHPSRLTLVSQNIIDGVPELLLDQGVGVALQDPGLSLDDLGQGPEAHAVAIRERTTLKPGDFRISAVFSASPQLFDDPGLANPRCADQRDELRLPLLT